MKFNSKFFNLSKLYNYLWFLAVLNIFFSTDIIQAKTFSASVRCDGVLLSKMDGSAKGGIVLAISDQLKLPVALIGTGESMDDLAVFDPDSFVDSLLES